MPRSPLGAPADAPSGGSGRRGLARAVGALGLVGVSVVAAPLTAFATPDTETQAPATASPDAAQPTTASEDGTTTTPGSDSATPTQDKGHRGSRSQHRDDSGDSTPAGPAPGSGSGTTDPAVEGGSDDSHDSGDDDAGSGSGAGVDDTSSEQDSGDGDGDVDGDGEGADDGDAAAETPVEEQPGQNEGGCHPGGDEHRDDDRSEEQAPGGGDSDGAPSQEPVQEPVQETQPWVSPADAVPVEATPVEAAPVDVTHVEATPIEATPVDVVPLSAPVVVSDAVTAVPAVAATSGRRAALTTADAPSSSQRSTPAKHRAQGPVGQDLGLSTQAAAPAVPELTTALGSSSGSSVQGSTDQLLAGVEGGIGTKLGSAVLAGAEPSAGPAEDGSGGPEAWLAPLAIGLGLVGAVGAAEGVMRKRRNNAA